MLDRPRYCPQCTRPTGALHCPADGVATIFVDGIDVLAAATLHAGALFAGRYRIVQRLGRGGFGAVYEAEHTGSGQRVALKVLALDPADGGKDVFFRFFREARITASLNHANTVRLYDFGQADTGALFMAMELLRGPTLEKMLTERFAEGAVLTGPQACRIGQAVLRSLAEAHAAQLVHRDLKPDNILLSEQGEDEPVVKVLDFGIARAGESKLTGNNRVLGTPAYMSPEQCKGGAGLDGRSDLYALGVILYRAVSGRTPFQGDVFALLRAHQEDPPPDLQSVAQTPLLPDFVALVERALAKRPQDRFADARSMRLALDAVLARPWQTPTVVEPVEVADTEDVLIVTTGLAIENDAAQPKTPVVVRRGPSGGAAISGKSVDGPTTPPPAGLTPPPDLQAVATRTPARAVATPTPLPVGRSAQGKVNLAHRASPVILACLAVVAVLGWWMTRTPVQQPTPATQLAPTSAASTEPAPGAPPTARNAAAAPGTTAVAEPAPASAAVPAALVVPNPATRHQHDTVGGEGDASGPGALQRPGSDATIAPTVSPAAAAVKRKAQPTVRRDKAGPRIEVIQ